MPNFLLIGAGKAGTTAIYEYLRQHPQVYMSPVKEPNFFAFMDERVNFKGPGEREMINRTSVTQPEHYRALFDGVKHESAVGEASQWYLYSDRAAERIKHYLPDIKMIAILRDPVKRAYSDFLHFVRDDREPIKDFMQAIQAEDQRIEAHWGFGHYIRRGLYHAQIKRYLDRFERHQIQIYLNEDLKQDATGLIQNIFNFLNIDETFQPDTSYRPNVSGIPQNKLLHRFLGKSNPIRTLIEPYAPAGLRKAMINLKGSNLAQPPLSPEVRQQLIPIFREDILNLQDLIDRDLSGWLQ
ncbi:MAG: sulfotransferase domain-containing protein [Cyanobacteria bacterium J06635_15]